MHKETIMLLSFFFLIILFCPIVPLQIFYRIWGIREFFDAKEISHRVPCFHIKGRAERHHCGKCRIKVKLTTSFRELWKWVLMLSSAGNVKGFSGFSFLWFKFYFYSLCQKKYFKTAVSLVLLLSYGLRRTFLWVVLGTTLRCLNGVQLKLILKCPQLSRKNDAFLTILKCYRKHTNSSEKLYISTA